MSEFSRRVFRFGDFEFDREKRTLWRDGDMVPLPPRASEVLLLLLERDGDLVERREIIDRVWQDAFVEEGNLNHAIAALRRTIGAKVVKTVPRRGYRFTAPVFDDADKNRLVLEKRTTATTVVEERIDADRTPLTAIFPFRLTMVACLVLLATVLVSVWIFVPLGNVGVGGDSSAGAIRSVAILPLRDLSGDRQNASLALGLTDSLITRIGRLDSVSVRPFTAVDAFPSSGMDALAFGRQIKTDAVVEGSVQNGDSRIRVSLRLFDSRDGRQIWAESFDEAHSDILKLQDILSGRLARALKVKLSDADSETVARRPTAHGEAYWHYMAGRERWLRRDWTDDSLAYYRRAIEIDPQFALAYVGIADQLAFTTDTARAEEAIERALAIDPELGEAHATRGFLAMFHRFDWKDAEQSFKRAIELAPNSSKAHHWYGVYLSMQGRLDEAFIEMQAALELDPTALVIMADIAELHYFRRDYQRAESELLKILEIDPAFLNARMYLIKVRYKNSGSYYVENAAFEIFRQQKRCDMGLVPEFDTAEMVQLRDRKDEMTLARQNLRQYKRDLRSNETMRYALARHYVVTGEKEKALGWLEAASELRGPGLITFIGVDPLWDPLRSEPRFQSILSRMGLA